MDDALDDGLEVSPYERLAARRAFHTWLRYWIACPTRRCRRWRRCAGDLDRCHAVFWPVVPEEIKEWWRAVGQARRDGCSARQAALLGDAAARRCRLISALQAPRANDDARCAVRDAGTLSSPLEGEGGLREAIASASRVRGQRFIKTPTPHPPSLGFASARAPSPARGEGSAGAARSPRMRSV
jgi:hypothetical protein